MDKTLIQHAEHDIHRHHGGDNKPDGAAQRRLEGERTALKLRCNIRWQGERFFRIENRLHRIAERIALRHVKRKCRDRELI